MKSSLRKRSFNLARKRKMKEVVKTIKQSITVKDVPSAEAKLSEAYKAIDKAAKRGVIKKNTASRKKSRLVKMIKNLKASL